MTTIRIFESTAERLSTVAAFYEPAAGEGWVPTSWERYRGLVRATGKSLIALGATPGAGVAIIGANRPEWFISYLGAMAAGAVPSGIYTTNTSQQCEYIIGHSEAVVAFVEDATQLEKFLDFRERVPTLRSIVQMKGAAEGDGILDWESFLAAGATIGDEDLDARWDGVADEDLATLIYTSGTTGPPKAVMLSHRNLTWTAAMIAEVLGLDEKDRMLSYLPLSHIAEQVLTLHTPLRSGTSIWFVPQIETVGDAIREVRPTIFFGVPRVWEKMAATMKAVGERSPSWRRKLVAWARRVGLEGGYSRQLRRPRPWNYGLAERLVFAKVREKIGFDQARMCVTSAAPISLETLEFFLSLGLPIDEVYGMSECTGPTTMSTPGFRRIGAAGMVAPGTDLRTLDDGEILIRGPHVFMGYYKDEEATNRVLDRDGWLHSGDVGEIDADGFLRITDRKKELIITAGGHNVSPANIEKQLKTIPGISQAIVVGDRRNYLVALLTVDRDALPSVASAIGSGAVDPSTAKQCPRLRRYLTEKIEHVNRTLARSETIKKFEILTTDFGVDTGELTPTMKLRRRIIHEKYAVEIDALY